MKNKNLIVLVTVFALIAATAWACTYVSKNRRLGAPGLKIADKNIYDEEGNVVGKQIADLPDYILNYVASSNLSISKLELQTLPADTTYGRRIYFSPDKFGILLSVVMMGQDSRSIHRPEHCLPGQGWRIEKSETVNVPVTQPVSYALPVKKVTATREVVGEGGKKQKLQALYVYWFVAENDITADHLDRMWKMGWSMVTKRELQRWSYVAAMAHCAPGAEDATFARMQEFIAASVPKFQLATGKPSVTETAFAEPQK